MSTRLAILIALTLNGLIVLFHALVLLQVIPYSIVWGGRLHSVSEMQQFEAVSMAINLFFGTVLLLRGNLIKNKLPQAWLNGILWFFLLVFALNTIGNIYAAAMVEKLIFTPITFVLAYLCWQLVRSKSK